VPYLEPVVWKDGWPVIGNDGIDVSKDGTPYRKPNVGKAYPAATLTSNDTFTGAVLDKMWQWNHNADAAAWSLFDRPDGCDSAPRARPAT
jgi:beta-xylosidase